MSSLRVMPGCYITGQAAGMAAAMAAAKDHAHADIRKVPVAELQQNLIGFGGYVPNAQKASR